MRPIWRLRRWLTVVFLVGMVSSGCGRGAGGARVEVAELGLSMVLPAGWRADRRNPGMFLDRAKPDDNFGMVDEYPLEGKTLSEYVDWALGSVEGLEKAQEALLKGLAEAVGDEGGGAEGSFRTGLVSRTPLTISGLEAIELVTQGVYTVIEVNIRKGNSVIRVSFRTLKEDFSEQEAALRGALRSIEIE